MKCPACLYEGKDVPHPIDGRVSAGVQCFGVKKGARNNPAIAAVLDTGAVKRASALTVDKPEFRLSLRSNGR